MHRRDFLTTILAGLTATALPGAPPPDETDRLFLRLDLANEYRLWDEAATARDRLREIFEAAHGKDEHGFTLFLSSHPTSPRFYEFVERFDWMGGRSVLIAEQEAKGMPWRAKERYAGLRLRVDAAVHASG